MDKIEHKRKEYLKEALTCGEDSSDFYYYLEKEEGDVQEYRCTFKTEDGGYEELEGFKLIVTGSGDDPRARFVLETHPEWFPEKWRDFDFGSLTDPKETNYASFDNSFWNNVQAYPYFTLEGMKIINRSEFVFGRRPQKTHTFMNERLAFWSLVSLQGLLGDGEIYDKENRGYGFRFLVDEEEIIHVYVFDKELKLVEEQAFQFEEGKVKDLVIWIYDEFLSKYFNLRLVSPKTEEFLRKAFCDYDFEFSGSESVDVIEVSRDGDKLINLRLVSPPFKSSDEIHLLATVKTEVGKLQELDMFYPKLQKETFIDMVLPNSVQTYDVLDWKLRHLLGFFLEKDTRQVRYGRAYNRLLELRDEIYADPRWKAIEFKSLGEVVPWNNHSNPRRPDTEELVLSLYGNEFGEVLQIVDSGYECDEEKPDKGWFIVRALNHQYCVAGFEEASYLISRDNVKEVFFKMLERVKTKEGVSPGRVFADHVHILRWRENQPPRTTDKDTDKDWGIYFKLASAPNHSGKTLYLMMQLVRSSVFNSSNLRDQERIFNITFDKELTSDKVAEEIVPTLRELGVSLNNTTPDVIFKAMVDFLIQYSNEDFSDEHITSTVGNGWNAENSPPF